MKTFRQFLVFILFFLIYCPLHASIRLHRIFQDGMVLQRDQEVSIWGWSENEDKIRVQLNNETYTAVLSENHEWNCIIPAQPAGGPYQIRVKGKEVCLIDDVYFGDVWLCSGQSNMETPMSRVAERYPEEIGNSDYPMIRIFKVAKTYNFNRKQTDFSSGEWKTANPQNTSSFSALAYFFAKNLHEHLQIPIGIINASSGGTPIESWMSDKALEAYPESLAKVEPFRDSSYLQSVLKKNQEIYQDWDQQTRTHDKGLNGSTQWFENQHDKSNWKTTHVPGIWVENGIPACNGVVWYEKKVELTKEQAEKTAKLYLGRIINADTTYVNGVQVGRITYQYPPRVYTIPEGLLKEGSNTIVIRAESKNGHGSFILDKQYQLKTGEEIHDLEGEWSYAIGCQLEPMEKTVFIQSKPIGHYNAMIAPLQNVAMKGVLWYQGESNTSTPTTYQHKLSTMIMDWRRLWENEELPFVIVQLANYMEQTPEPTESNWARLRDQQRRVLELPHTGLAVTIDLGEWNDIHPLNKGDVAYRSLLAARRLVYGEKIMHSGPMIQAAEMHDENHVILRFETYGGEMVTKVAETKLLGFEIAGKDGHFHKVEAVIHGSTVELMSENITNPSLVRYAWANNPVRANLYNNHSLPASPFEILIKK